MVKKNNYDFYFSFLKYRKVIQEVSMISTTRFVLRNDRLTTVARYHKGTYMICHNNKLNVHYLYYCRIIEYTCILNVYYSPLCETLLQFIISIWGFPMNVNKDEQCSRNNNLKYEVIFIFGYAVIFM